MYVWNVSVASRGSQEVASCLYKHFGKYIPKDTEKIILRSDTCSGQHRNIKLALMLKKVFSQFDFPVLLSIEQHFYVSGHSYNSCDRSFALVQNQKEVPEHWIEIMRQAKETEPKFIVTEMLKTDFYSSMELEALITNRKKSTEGGKISWLKTQKIIYERYSPFLLDIVEYGASSIMSISLQKRGTHENFDLVKLTPLYVEPRKIAYSKYKDLQRLLKYLPEQYHAFYRKLQHDRDDSTKDYAYADFQSSDEDDTIDKD